MANYIVITKGSNAGDLFVYHVHTVTGNPEDVLRSNNALLPSEVVVDTVLMNDIMCNHFELLTSIG